MSTASRITRNALLAATGLCIASFTLAGPLSPPAGPVSSSYKTLNEVEPRTPINVTNTPGDGTCVCRITQPGSYYLTGHLTGVSGKSGIYVDASDVTIDLNGFSLIGAPGSFSGIRVSSSAGGLSIRNGSVRSWGSSGINLSEDDTAAAPSPGARIENIVASNNGYAGFDIGGSSILTRCIAIHNTSVGFLGVTANRFVDCTAKSNTGYGFLVHTGNLLTGCTAYDNDDTGIFVLEGCTISNCTSQHNAGDGFSIAGTTAMDHCAAQYNTDSGVSALGLICRPQITDCSFEDNYGGNIAVLNDAVVRNNRCQMSDTTHDNIRVTGNNCRIEGNHCTGGEFGIFLVGSAAHNIVIGNSTAGGAYAWITPNNTIGPVITTSGTISSTSPFANFQY